MNISFAQSSSPTSAAFNREDVTTLKTPEGIPASSASIARANALNGVSSAGYEPVNRCWSNTKNHYQVLVLERKMPFKQA